MHTSKCGTVCVCTWVCTYVCVCAWMCVCVRVCSLVAVITPRDSTITENTSRWVSYRLILLAGVRETQQWYWPGLGFGLSVSGEDWGFEWHLATLISPYGVYWLLVILEWRKDALFQVVDHCVGRHRKCGLPARSIRLYKDAWVYEWMHNYYAI